MRVWLDNAELTDVAGAGLRGALEAASAAAAANGRVIVEVWADGQPVSNEALADPSPDPGAHAEVRLTTAEPRSLVAVTLHDAADAVDSVRTPQGEAASDVQGGRFDQALAGLGQVLAIWQAAHDAVQNGAALVGLDLNAVEFETPGGGREGVIARVESLAGKLGELKRSVTEQDWTGVSDVLAYDLEEEASAWGVMLRALGDRVRAGEGTTGE